MSKATTNFQDLLKAIDQTDTDADLLAKGGDDEQDDAIIADASQSSESDNGEADEAGAVGKDKGKDMAKSLTAKDADGKDVEVVDATDMIKSLQDKIDSQESIMAKALTGLQSTLSKQNTLIKSLQDNIAKMSGEGRGRKAVLRAVDKPGAGETMAKSEGAAEDGKITMDEFFAKAETAFSNKKISGNEFNTIDVCRRMGAPIDAALVRKVALS